MKNSVIIRGCRGFIGSSFYKIASQLGYKVLDYEKDVIPSDLSDSCVINFAWHGTSGPLRGDYNAQINNIRDSLDFMKLVAELNCKQFINAGSIMEYEVSLLMNIDGFSPSINTIYSTAKLATDYMLRAYAAENNIDYINCVISNIYGPGEKSPRFLNTTLRKMLNNENIDLTDGLQKYDFIYIDDAIKAFLTIIDKGANNTNYYIGNENIHTLKSYILKMKEITQSSSSLNFGKINYTDTSSIFDTLNLHKCAELGFNPTISFEEGVRNTINWIQQN